MSTARARRRRGSGRRCPAGCGSATPVAGGRLWQLGDGTPACLPVCLPTWLAVAARGDDGLWCPQAREGASGFAGRTESTSVFLAPEVTISFGLARGPSAGKETS
jgi:hypothetical protein